MKAPSTARNARRARRPSGADRSRPSNRLRYHWLLPSRCSGVWISAAISAAALLLDNSSERWVASACARTRVSGVGCFPATASNRLS